jgi:hypothetical protein
MLVPDGQRPDAPTLEGLPLLNSELELPDALLVLLFVQWINTIATAELGVTQYSHSDNNWEFSRQPAGDAFVVELTNQESGWLVHVRQGFDVNVINSIAQRAADATRRRDLGAVTVYRAEFVSPEPDIIALSAQFMRNLGDRVLIAGWRRLSDVVLLQFVPEQISDEAARLFAPTITVRAYLFVPGGGPGPLSNKVAADSLELIRLICAFALGRPVIGFVGPAFPATTEEARCAEAKRYDSSILTLARNQISLDPFRDLLSIGSPSSLYRYRSSLVAFDAAIVQSNPDVATILFVSGIEAILSPDAPWRKTRLVTRFIRAILEYAPDTVDVILGHSNMSQAFAFTPTGGLNNRRRRILERIYELRSTPVHSGLAMAVGWLNEEATSGQVRVALLSNLLQGVLLAFLKAPRSSLIGHPEIWPGEISAD